MIPSQDGPSHVYNSWILANWNRPSSEIFRCYYSINHRPEPNWASHILLTGLLKTGLPPAATEKTIVSFFIFFFACGMWRALGAVAGPARALAPVALPVALGWPVGMGFYNFCLGLAGFLWVFAWWYPRRNEMTPPRMVALAAMAIALYFAHLVAVGAIIVVVGVITLWESPAERPVAAALKRRFLPSALALLPAVVLGMAFVAASVAKGQMHELPPIEFGLWKLRPLLTLQNMLVCYSTVEVFPAALLAVSMLASSAAVLVRIRRDRRGSQPALAVSAAALAALYCVAPNKLAGGTYFYQRLVPFIFFMLLLWLGANYRQGRVMFWLRASGIAIAVVFGCMRIAQFARLNDYLAEYVSVGNAIEAPATILPLCFSPRGESSTGYLLSSEVALFSHASGYIAAGRPIVDLSDYEAAMKYFPLLWRPEVHPGFYIAPDVFDDPYHANLLDYGNRTDGRGRIDYVLVWSSPEYPPPADLFEPVKRQLDAGYKLIATSRPRGYARLYARVQ